MSENSSAPNSPSPAAPPPAQPQAQPPQTTPSAPPTKSNGNGVLRSPAFVWSAAIALAVLLFIGLNSLISTLTGESTDDAFITGHIVSIAPRISGQVSAVHVLDNQLVKSNDLLVEIDPSDYAATLGQKEAAKESEDSDLEAAKAGYELMAVKVKTAEAEARESRADAAASAATDARAKADFTRAEQLVKENTISSQEFDQFKATAEEEDANLNSANAKAASDQSKVNEAKAQLAAAKAEADAVLAQVHESKTEVDSAQLNVDYTKIYAPCDGLVTRKQVEVGDYLQTGQTILSLVPTDVWVVANFKETQLKDIRPGQPVSVTIDSLGRTFRGHVDSVQAGSGATFSLLPPENATGNYVNVVQRVPVKILFDEPLPADKTVGPGLSVEPTVQVTSFSVPRFVTAVVAIILAIAAGFIFKMVLNRKGA